MTADLFAWLEGRPVGRFTATGPGEAVFVYDDQAGETPVSLSMPRDGGWVRAAPYRFLDNLLPDDDRTRCRLAHDALLLRPSGVTLAPAYDQVATLYWPGLDTGLAMKIGGASRSAAVTPDHWAKLARSCSLDENRVVDAARAMSGLVTQVAPEAVSGADPHLRDRFLAVIGGANRGMADS